MGLVPTCAGLRAGGAARGSRGCRRGQWEAAFHSSTKWFRLLNVHLSLFMADLAAADRSCSDTWSLKTSAVKMF